MSTCPAFVFNQEEVDFRWTKLCLCFTGMKERKKQFPFIVILFLQQVNFAWNIFVTLRWKMEKNMQARGNRACEIRREEGGRQTIIFPFSLFKFNFVVGKTRMLNKIIIQERDKAEEEELDD